MTLRAELALATADVRAEKLGQRVFVLDPFDTTGGKLDAYKAGFNPMAMMQPSSLIEDAILIADALVLPAGGGGDPHWDQSARTLIEGVILEVATADRFEGRRDLVTVRNLIAEGEAWAVSDSDGKTLRPAWMSLSSICARAGSLRSGARRQIFLNGPTARGTAFSPRQGGICGR